MTGTCVLDACAVIAFLRDEAGAESVEALLCAAEEGRLRLSMNKVNLLEVYSMGSTNRMERSTHKRCLRMSDGFP